MAEITTRAIIQGNIALSRPRPEPMTSFNRFAIQETTLLKVNPVVVSKVDVAVFIIVSMAES